MLVVIPIFTLKNITEWLYDFVSLNYKTAPTNDEAMKKSNLAPNTMVVRTRQFITI